MRNNFEKIAFLVAIIGVAFITRLAAPIAGGLPTLSLADQAATAHEENPPMLVLDAPGSAAALTAGSGGAHNDPAPDTSLDTGSSSFTRTGTAPAPTLADHAALVADLASGTVFYSLNTDSRWPTASLTKLMTATLVEDNFDLTQKITLTQKMFAIDPEEFTLAPGGTYTVSDLLHVMLMPSSNVAAESFAETYGKTNFMTLMNQRAAQWGMASTYFDDPAGISAANQSTAHDMMLLAQKIYNNYRQVFSFTDTPQITITEYNSGQKVLVKSINDFAGGANFIGGKTGHTDQADGNLLSVFSYDSHPIVIVVLGTNTRFNDTQRLYNWFKANYK